MVSSVRSKVPVLQDAFLREVNRATIVRADDPKAVDVETLTARLVARMQAILPGDTVSALEFARIVVAPMAGIAAPVRLRRCVFSTSLAGSAAFWRWLRKGHGRAIPTTRIRLMSLELILVLACGVLALLYGGWLTSSLLSKSAGTPAMQAIAAAIHGGGPA